MQNFGRIKYAFNELISEGISTRDVKSQKLFKNYIRTIKENEMLKTQFLVISNIEEKIEPNREKAIEFVKENIALFSSFDKNKIIEANDNLSKFITLCEKGDLLNENIDYTNKKLHENIAKLIFTKRGPSTVDTIIEATSEIVDYIVNNQPKIVSEVIEIPSSMLSTIMVTKYNEKYASLDETEKKILRVIIDSTPEEKSNVYKETVRECIDLINVKLNEADLNSKDKLLRVKDKLLNDKVDINEDFEKKISKLIGLKESLI